MYAQDEGRNLSYLDRLSDQQEINRFIQMIFGPYPAKHQLNFEEYQMINQKLSSEMFFSIMSLLHERLPCSNNCFRLKKIFRSRLNSSGPNPQSSTASSCNSSSARSSVSPVKVIASPNMMRGISLM